MNIRRLFGEKKEEDRKLRIARVIGIIAGFVIAMLVLLFKGSIIFSIISLFIVIILVFGYTFFKASLDKSNKIKKMEQAFPDFLQLVSSNLRSGMTIDKSILLSARKEFAPLDEEILRVGKDITTGRSVEQALRDMSNRIGSDKIDKTILLILSGMQSGGNLAILLEQTSSNMTKREFVEKRASSNVLMYVIFIFIAVAVGAPMLFGLSGIMVETMSNMVDTMPAGIDNVNTNMPISFSEMNVSLDFLFYFSIIFLIVIDVLACLILGLVSKGEEKAGVRYLFPLLTISLGVFFIIKYVLSGFISGMF
ncbi:MAG: type II secretion system F family protein [Candidatus Nanoarchaeia archaeon]